jgi:hypothetical protein
MKSERDIRRLFADHGLDVIRVRRGKHWVVFASRNGEVGRFVLSQSPSDWRVQRKREAELKRGGYPLTRSE